MKYKSLIVLALAATSLVTAARADEVTFEGSTMGTALPTGLTFAGSTFGPTTTTSGTATLNFGTFTLGNSGGMFSSVPFTLTVMFMNPAGIAGGNSPTFSATVNGFASAGFGGFSVFFTNPTQTLPFSYSSGGFTTTGTFTLNVPGTGGGGLPGSTAQLQGFVTAASQATVPDGGATVSLLGMAFVGLAALRRKFGLV